MLFRWIASVVNARLWREENLVEGAAEQVVLERSAHDEDRPVHIGDPFGPVHRGQIVDVPLIHGR